MEKSVHNGNYCIFLYEVNGEVYVFKSESWKDGWTCYYLCEVRNTLPFSQASDRGNQNKDVKSLWVDVRTNKNRSL